MNAEQLMEEAKKEPTELYELDRQLSQDDRKGLYEFYNKAKNSFLTINYCSFFVGLTTPYALRYYKQRNFLKVNPLSALGLGLVSTLAAPILFYSYVFPTQRNQFVESKGSESIPAKLVYKFPTHSVGHAYVYYLNSSKDASKIMKDPRSIPLDADHMRSPGILSSGDLFGRKGGGGSEGGSSPEAGISGSWENVRRGKVEENYNQDSQDSDDPFESKAETPQAAQLSSWEKIRKEQGSANPYSTNVYNPGSSISSSVTDRDDNV